MANGNTAIDSAAPRDFSAGIVFFRRLMFILEAGLALFLVFRARMEIGILFLAYGVVCVFLLFPFVHCSRCAYYGKRCSLGWGRIASRMFPRKDIVDESDFRGMAILFWPLRLLPVLLGLYTILQATIMWKFYLIPQGLFGIYLLILLLQKMMFKAYSCPTVFEGRKS